MQMTGRKWQVPQGPVLRSGSGARPSSLDPRQAPGPGPRASLIRDSDAGSSLEPIILGVRKSPFLCLARLGLAGHGEGLVSCDLLEWKQWRGSFLTHKPCGSPA